MECSNAVFKSFAYELLLRSLAFTQKEQNMISIAYLSKGPTIFMKQFFFVSV